MLKLGLKCSLDPNQIFDRLSYNPDVLEIQLFEEDLFGNNLLKLNNTISLLKRKGIQVYLHHPIRFQGVEVDIIHDNEKIYHYYHLTTKILAEVCAKHQIKCVIHPHYVNSPSSDINQQNQSKIIEHIIEILKYSGDCFIWENTIEGIFSSINNNWIDEIVKPLNLPIVYDISHAFIAYKGDNQLLQKEINKLSPFVEYFHVVDSFGLVHDGLELGTGGIDWLPLIPYIENKSYIYETGLKDFNDAKEMIMSHKYLTNLNKK